MELNQKWGCPLWRKIVMRSLSTAAALLALYCRLFQHDQGLRSGILLGIGLGLVFGERAIQGAIQTWFGFFH